MNGPSATKLSQTTKSAKVGKINDNICEIITLDKQGMENFITGSFCYWPSKWITSPQLVCMPVLSKTEN